ncbi:type II toxin-antitoxin system Phd/YefM family antitoxin [candidate division CSSED10-310 bacterium]|uniref:Antitoxin n=1 Tax=candidate division CSSED10-310 bacterium TaxID=2855610 RepID=A0ABV6YW64_UNCC1
MKTIWKLQDAKSRFSELVNDALKKGPQYVTRRGKETVVVISVKEFSKLISDKPDFKTFLMSCPKVDDFQIERSKDPSRYVDL